MERNQKMKLTVDKMTRSRRVISNDFKKHNTLT